MTVTITWLRLEWQRRWRSLAVLTLLVAFASGTVLAAVAGARRGSTAVERLKEGTLPATVTVLPNEQGFDWDKVRALPEVEALTGFVVSGYTVDGIPLTENVSTFPPADDEMFRTIERPVVLEGRLPDPTRVDEVVVSSKFPGSYHRGVGDRLTLRLMSVEQAAKQYDGGSGEPPQGPAIPVTIVGVVRFPWGGEQIADKGGLLPTPALFAKYRQYIAGPDTYINALVRLKGGEAAISDFREGLARVTGRSDIDVWDNEQTFLAPARRVIDFEAGSLLAFGLAALAAAIALVGQSVARYAAATVADLQALRAVGMTPRQMTVASCAGPFLAAVAGTVLGVAAAAVASIWMPIGLAALREPDPGFDFDWLVLGTGLVTVPALVLVGAAVAVLFARAATREEVTGRRSFVALWAARLGLPVPVVIGARFALEPGRGRGAVPVRPALLGAVAGVLGVLAAFTFSAGVQDAADHTERFGQTHQLESFLGFNGQDFTPAARRALEAVARDPKVAGVTDIAMAVAESGTTSINTFTYDPVGTAAPAVLVDGRMPRTEHEIVLAPLSAEATGVGVGGQISLGGGAVRRTMTVTGIAFVPNGPHNSYSDGAWTTPAGYARLFEGARYAYKFHWALIALRPGVDPAGARESLKAAAATVKGGENLGFSDPEAIPEVRQLRDVQELPVILAGFLAVLAVGAVGHALATAVRRRRHDVAVLRALGMTRGQARWTVVVQGTLLAAVGLAFGIPLGVALGRVLWRVVADITPLAYVAPIAIGALLLACPLALAVANLLALWPGHLASRLRIGHILRTE